MPGAALTTVCVHHVLMHVTGNYYCFGKYVCVRFIVVLSGKMIWCVCVRVYTCVYVCVRACVRVSCMCMRACMLCLCTVARQIKLHQLTYCLYLPNDAYRLRSVQAIQRRWPILVISFVPITQLVLG